MRPRLLLAALLVAAALLLVAPTHAAELQGSLEEDKAALLSLKAASANPEPLSDWSEDTLPCNGEGKAKWPYIKCSRGRVVDLDLEGQSIGATLPDDLSNLSALLLLNLVGCGISGSLPAAWSTGFQRLASMQLSNNNITGGLPDSWAGEKVFPQILDVSLDDNQLTGPYPESWTGEKAFEKLRYLDLSYNQLSGSFPATLGQKSSTDKLKQLLLNNNNFTGNLPAEWGNAFPALETLDVESNNLTGPFPEEWLADTAFPALTNLLLGDNWLGGSFDEEELATMDRGLPAGLGLSPLGQRLVTLDVSANNFTGSLPEDWAEAGSWPLLGLLHLTDNWLNGSLPDIWAEPNGALGNLTVLELGNNTLTGMLNPKWGTLGGLASLSSLNLEGNELTGGLPPEWAAWTVLSELHVDGNPLSGGLPAEWGQEGLNLNKLSFCDTGIAGPIPSSWAGDDAMKYVDISTDIPGGLCGTLPAKFVDGGASLRQCMGYGRDVPVSELPAC